MNLPNRKLAVLLIAFVAACGAPATKDRLVRPAQDFVPPQHDEPSPEDQELLAEHIVYGIPQYDDPGPRVLLIRSAYVLSHNPVDKIADWASPSRLPWAELFRRVFREDLLACPRCPARMEVLAAITAPDTVDAILPHLGLPAEPPPIAPARAPPQPTWWPSGTDRHPAADAFEPA